MSELADLTNAQPVGPIPGYTLSAPRIQDIAKAEVHVAGEFKEEVADLCSRLLRRVPANDPKAESLYRAAAADAMIAAVQEIKAGAFKYPHPAFNLHMLANTTLPHLVLWSLQAKHEKITLVDVVKILNDATNLDAIASATYDLWGYLPKKTRRRKRGDGKPIEWGAIFRRCCLPGDEGGLGLSPDEFANLTVPQLAALLNGGKKNIDRAELDDIRRQYAFERFDAICDQRDIEPRELGAADDATLVQWIKDAGPAEARGHDVDVKTARKDLKAYLRECE